MHFPHDIDLRGESLKVKESLVGPEIVEAYPEIAEMDLNPVIAYENGARIVDARIILRDESNSEETRLAAPAVMPKPEPEACKGEID
jgi:hypothetical protein